MSELVEGPPAAVALATGTVATPIDNIIPPTAATTVPVTGESPPSSGMRTPSSSPPIGPSVVALSVTLLLISGVRHQFTMDETYLEQHSVKAQSGKESLRDPFEMSVWQLKECIWKDWKDGMFRFSHAYPEVGVGVSDSDFLAVSRMGSKTS